MAPRRTEEEAAPPIEYSLLLTATMCLLAFGVVMVFSASSTTSLLGGSGDPYYYLKRTALFGAVGLVLLKVLSGGGVQARSRPDAGDPRDVLLPLRRRPLPGMGVEVNGAKRWIGAGMFQIQPSEIMKVALILYGAQLLATRPKMTRELRTMVPYLGVVCARVRARGRRAGSGDGDGRVLCRRRDADCRRRQAR